MSDRKAQRAARAEQRRARIDERKRQRAREASQPPAFSWRRVTRVAERPGHQASTAHVQAAYPAVAEAGLGAQGVYIGRDFYGGSFCYDPWVLYGRRVLTNANTIVIGTVGFAKSSLSKSYVWRQFVFGRQAEFIDPKGEYAPLVEAMGGVTLRLEPGGSVKLNPLTRIGSREMREGLLEAVTRAMLDRGLSQAESVGLVAALEAADAAKQLEDVETCIPDVIAQLRAPSPAMADRIGMTVEETRIELRECALALQRLREGPLRGMFDEPTSAGEEAWDAPAVCLDLSAVMNSGSTSGNLALGITMVCASAFLDAKRIERTRQAAERGATAPKVIRVNDEAWRALPIAGLGEYYQSAFKLSRATGVQHWLVLHRLSDLRAAGDEGTRQQRLAEGLLSDASTVIVYRQDDAELPATTRLLGLSSTEAEHVKHLQIGQGLWRVGGRSFLVSHVLSEREWALIDTDSAMLEPERNALDAQALEELASVDEPAPVGEAL